jgi:YVTN family beta-propeller protein
MDEWFTEERRIGYFTAEAPREPLARNSLYDSPDLLVEVNVLACNSDRVYVGLENSDAVVAIDTLKNKIIATIPIGQTPRALVCVPGALAVFHFFSC